MGVIRRLKKEIWSRLDIAQTRECARLAAGYRLPGGYRRIYHYHIRKTGGTSLNDMFFSLGGEDGATVHERLTRHPCHRIISGDKVFQSHYPRLINRGDYFYAFSHEPMHRLSLPPHTFTIAIIREPVKRMISLYRMFLGYADLPRLTDHHRRYMAWLGNNFSDFLANLPKEFLWGQLYPFSKSCCVEETFDRIAACSFFFPIEDFDRGARRLGEKLELSLIPRHARKGQAKAHLEAADMERAREILEPETRLYEKLLDLWKSRAQETEDPGA